MLNSSLLKRPDLLCKLTGLILRFRKKCVALSADIEAMFMHVSLLLQIDASYDIYGVTKIMSTIALFLVQQAHGVQLSTLFNIVLRTTKLCILTLQIKWLDTTTWRISMCPLISLNKQKNLRRDVQTVLATW